MQPQSHYQSQRNSIPGTMYPLSEPISERCDPDAEQYLDHILFAVHQPHLRHYVEGLWLQPMVRARITASVSGHLTAAQLWRAVCRVKDNPWAQADVHDLAIAVTVMHGLRTLVYDAAEPGPGPFAREADRTPLQKVLVHSSTASLVAPSFVDPRNHGLLMQAMAFQSKRKPVRLTEVQAEFQARLQTLVLLAWAHCDAELESWEARP